MPDLVDSPAAFDTPTARWISELELSEKAQEKWQACCREINRRYVERRTGDGLPALRVSTGRRFAVLWSNIQVLKPAVYAKMPVPVVTRRFKDEDPVGRLAGEVSERALIYSIDAYDFDWVMKQCRDSDLLFGRGQVRVRYVPHFAPLEGQEAREEGEEQVTTNEAADEATQTGERVAYEEVVCDYFDRLDFGTNVARNWAEVRFCWFRAYMTRAELMERFGEEIGGQVPLDWKPENGSDDQAKAEQFNKACVYEVWDKVDRKVRWISKSYPKGPLDEKDDPLGLSEFFPCPRPLLSTCGDDSTIPIPDYIFYQDQAEEVDELTVRIGVLIHALRMVGVYAGESKNELQLVFNPNGNPSNTLIPVDSWAAFKDKGGIGGVIEWVPIDMVVQCLTGCFETRKALLGDIYQITGISDIMRGETDPNETKGAQELKSSWGSSRVRERQKEIARFARDILRIKAEIIASKFGIDTYKAVTDIKLMTNEEKALAQQQLQVMQQQAQMQAQMAQTQGQQAPQAPPPTLPPEIMRMLGEPSWEDVDALLKNKALRGFRIDVETDSTIEPDQAKSRQEAVEYATAIGGLISNAGPIVAAAPALMPWVGETAKMVARRFGAGRELEDILDKCIDAIEKMPPQKPEGEKAGPDPQIEMAKLEVEKQKVAVAAKQADIDAMRAKIEEFKAQSAHILGEGEIDAENKRTDAQRVNDLLDSLFAQQSDSAENERQREHDANENQLDRDNAVKVAAAKPKPTVGAK